MEINVVLAPDNNYAKHCGAVMASVAANASKDSSLNFHILDGGLSEENKRKLGEINAGKPYGLNFIKIDEKDFEGFPASAYISVSTWYRFKISSILPQTVKRALYLDCDIIALSPLDELFEMPMGRNLIGACTDCLWSRFNKRMKLPNSYRYFNAGVLLIDVEAWRNENIEQKLFKYLADDTSRLGLMDQNVLNIELGDRAKNIGLKWNFQYTIPFIEESCYYTKEYKREYAEAFKAPCIIHYVGTHKPWKTDIGKIHPFRSLYYKYLALTPWKSDADNESRRLEAEEGKSPLPLYLKTFARKLFRKPALLFRKSYWGCVCLSACGGNKNK